MRTQVVDMVTVSGGGTRIKLWASHALQTTTAHPTIAIHLEPAILLVLFTKLKVTGQTTATVRKILTALLNTAMTDNARLSSSKL
jgi:hypothetical protein